MECGIKEILLSLAFYVALLAGPLLAVCGLLTLSYLALVVLYLCRLEGIPWRLYLLIPRYIDSGLPLLLGGGWYAATRQSG